MILIFYMLYSWIASSQECSESFEELMRAFDNGYAALEIPQPAYDYKDELQSIPDLASIERQLHFFHEMDVRLHKISREDVPGPERLNYDHLRYEIDFNLQRLALERAWRSSGDSQIPTNGLSSLSPEWYQYRIKRFTCVDISPVELFAFGESEVARVKEEIRRIRVSLGFAKDSIGFNEYLKSEEFILNDKQEIITRYNQIKEVVYSSLDTLFSQTEVSNVEFMEWPGADRFTPPGYYNPDNAYGVPVFHFNFHGSRHNRRSMEWLFLHEAVPGHHYQWWIRQRLPDQPAFKRHFSYPGNFEGWAAYVENLGKDLNVYRDPYSELGKWEWDLVRSTRILIDVGIHHFGWSHDDAITCWKKHIPGQDEIAEREVIRCTNWPGQALSYKVGAWKIKQLRDKLLEKNPQRFSLRVFHDAFLRMGQTPLSVIEKNMLG